MTPPYIMAGQLDSALAVCEQALSINLNWRKYHRYAAYVYLFKGNKTKAFARLHQATAKNPDQDPGILRNRGYFYLYEGNYGESLKNLDKAIRVTVAQKDSSNARYAMMHRAKLLTEMNRFKEARAAFRQVRKFSRPQYSSPVTPVDVIGEYGTGVTYLREGNLQTAGKKVRKIFALVASNQMDSLFNDYAYLLRGEIQLARGEAPEALISLNHVSNYSINSPRLKLLKSQALAGSGKIDEAVALLSKAKDDITNRNPAQGGGDYFDYFYLRSHTPYLLGRFYEENGLDAKANENYRKAIELWKHADTSLPELKDARQRTARLSIRKSL